MDLNSSLELVDSWVQIVNTTVTEWQKQDPVESAYILHYSKLGSLIVLSILCLWNATSWRRTRQRIVAPDDIRVQYSKQKQSRTATRRDQPGTTTLLSIPFQVITTVLTWLLPPAIMKAISVIINLMICRCTWRKKSRDDGSQGYSRQRTHARFVNGSILGNNKDD